MYTLNFAWLSRISLPFHLPGCLSLSDSSPSTFTSRFCTREGMQCLSSGSALLCFLYVIVPSSIQFFKMQSIFLYEWAKLMLCMYITFSLSVCIWWNLVWFLNLAVVYNVDRASEIAQWVKVLTAKLSLVPEFNSCVSQGGRKELVPSSWSLTSTRALWHTSIYIPAHV